MSTTPNSKAHPAAGKLVVIAGSFPDDSDVIIARMDDWLERWLAESEEGPDYIVQCMSSVAARRAIREGEYRVSHVCQLKNDRPIIVHESDIVSSEDEPAFEQFRRLVDGEEAQRAEASG